ncbi:phage antirepressor [Brevibacterium sp. 91QC2O2]|uniref:phage antirepressor n=1 Tax=Brevibacterium TaxID=1696 RepID=UPI00211C0015|nr:MULTISPECIES: phage antirepressor [unclassified Brevibacterium]MCQ9367378.1 phage antirepressor [Brevibacterium sp. 91QC2O2]MCQ9384609.1 phage antirepressor [Brevibacterium sp. 68QC2CO]
MNELNIFNYQGTEVRTVLIDGGPWFVLADLIRVLGLKQYRQDRLGDDMIQNHPIADTLGRLQSTAVVSEAGMYEVVIRSDKPEAAVFRRWITSEVLPSIRKTGSYGTGAPALDDQQIVARALQITTAQIAELEQTVEQQAPIVAYHERYVAESDDIITIENFAGQYQTTGPRVRELLDQRRLATRKKVGSHWSRKENRMVEDFEWRARQGQRSSEWFDLRPQHNAPRLHNGQVRQTLYVRQYYAPDLAGRLGLVKSTAVEVQAEMQLGGPDADA